jgi:hypothetical protein
MVTVAQPMLNVAQPMLYVPQPSAHAVGNIDNKANSVQLELPAGTDLGKRKRENTY